MGRLWVFAACMVAAIIFVLSTAGNLPDPVAIHFAVNGAPDGWVERSIYRVALAVVLTMVPMLMIWLMAGLPRLIDGRGMIPNSNYWFAPERRQSTEEFLLAHAIWLGMLTMAVIVGFHITILRAHATSPSALNVDQLKEMLLIFLIALAWWFIVLVRRFQLIGPK